MKNKTINCGHFEPLLKPLFALYHIAWSLVKVVTYLLQLNTRNIRLLKLVIFNYWNCVLTV